MWLPDTWKQDNHPVAGSHPGLVNHWTHGKAALLSHFGHNKKITIYQSNILIFLCWIVHICRGTLQKQDFGNNRTFSFYNLFTYHTHKEPSTGVPEIHSFHQRIVLVRTTMRSYSHSHVLRRYRETVLITWRYTSPWLCPMFIPHRDCVPCLYLTLIVSHVYTSPWLCPMFIPHLDCVQCLYSSVLRYSKSTWAMTLPHCHEQAGSDFRGRHTTCSKWWWRNRPWKG